MLAGLAAGRHGGHLKAPGVACIIAGHADLHRIAGNADGLPSKFLTGVLADFLTAAVEDVEVVKAVLHLRPGVKRHVQGRSAVEPVAPDVGAAIVVVVRALKLRRVGADIGCIADRDLAGALHAAAVHGCGRDGRRALLERGHETVFVDGCDRGIRAAPRDALVIGAVRVDGRRHLERAERIHGQRALIQIDAGHGLQHRHLAAGADIAHRDLDRRRADADGFHHAVVTHCDNVRVRGLPVHNVREVFRRYAQVQLSRRTLIDRQLRLVQTRSRGLDLLIDELDAVFVGKGLGIGAGHAVDRQDLGIAERVRRNLRHTARNGNGGQLHAVLEGVVADGRHAARNAQTLQNVAVLKCGCRNRLQTAAELHSRERVAVIKHLLTNTRHAVRDRDGRERITVKKCTITNGLDRAGNRHFFERRAIPECVAFNNLRRLAPCNVLERSAALECIGSDCSYRLGQNDLLERGTAFKHSRHNILTNIRQRDLFQFCAATEYMITHVRHCVRNSDALKFGVGKCMRADLCYRFWYLNGF